ncbi:DUF4114 domain-containing protein [Synechococcus sp. UW140]|uniref:DUF4114 domain-containing protein n=1 Tax=Synechococcus sp. UW140 TaxID=368503 RepID=UPI003137B986
MSTSSLIENDPLDLDPRIGKSAGIGTDTNISEYGTVTLKCVGLQELSKNGPNFVLRLQYNRVLTTAEAMAIVDALQAQEGFSSSSILFNENIVSAGGYDGAGFDINATYIKLKYSGDKDTIAIDLPSDVVFLEWQIFSSPSNTVQPTFSGGDYFVFQDANGQDIANYPLEPGNRSLKSFGLLKSQKPSVDVNNFYSLVPTDSAQKGSTFKIDEETSSSNFLSGSKDKDGCNISYLLGVTAIQENQNLYGIPNIDHLAPYTSIQVKVDKSLIDGVFDPYLDRIVPLYSPANYISIGFHTIGQAVQSNTWDYGVSAHDIKQLGSDDDFYYVYFTTSPDVYEAAMAASGYPVYERPVYPPIVSPDGQRQKGYLLYNGNSSDLQGAMLMRIRNGNYTNADLEEFLAAPCYDTADENQPFVNGWVVFSTLDSSVRIRNTIYVSTNGQVITTRMTPTSGSIEGDVSFNRLAAAPTFTNQKAGLVIGQTGINFSLKLDQSSNGNTAKTAVDLAPLFDGLSTTNKRLAYFVYDSPVVGAPPVATPFTYDPTQKAGARFYDLYGNGTAHTADLQFIDGGYGDKDGKKNGVVVNPSTAGVVDLNAIFTASANSLTVADPTDSTSPAALTVRATLTAKAASVNQIGFVAFNANEADTLTYELVRDRGTILLANLESSDTPNVAAMKFQRDINLINGQKLVFFEVVDTTLESLLAKNTTLQGFGSSFRTLDLSKSTDTAATATKGGNTVALSLLNESAIAGLGDLISSQMADTPILDFTGLAGRTLEGSTVSLAREANYDTTIGFYRIQRADGAVLDPITNTLITPDLGPAVYKAAALSSSNLFNGFGTLAVANGATRTDTIAAFNESGLLAPYATVAQTGDTFFSFRSANSDNLNHFRVLGSGVIGLEDLNGGGDQDFDDNIVSFNFKLKGTVA